MSTSGIIGDMHIVCLAVCYSDVTICSKCEKKKKKKAFTRPAALPVYIKTSCRGKSF